MNWYKHFANLNHVTTQVLAFLLCSHLLIWTNNPSKNLNDIPHLLNQFVWSAQFRKCYFHPFYFLGTNVKNPGEPIGKGLTKSAAADLGLWEGMPVGTSIIDAHAGGLGKWLP